MYRIVEQGIRNEEVNINITHGKLMRLVNNTNNTYLFSVFQNMENEIEIHCKPDSKIWIELERHLGHEILIDIHKSGIIYLKLKSDCDEIINKKG